LTDVNQAEFEVGNYFVQPKHNMVNLKAMGWLDVPAFMERQFVVLTGCRSEEARAMPWAEIDLEQRLWRVPASRIEEVA
jgi:hypothetical protein